MRGRFTGLALALLLIAASPLAGLAEADEEQYFREITAIIAAADTHLDGISDAISNCLQNFLICTTNPSPFIAQLNVSRNGLITLRETAVALEVPDRYRTIHDLVTQGLTDIIEGIALYIEGLEEGSTQKLDGGGDLTSTGTQELQLAVDLLAQTPPTSPLQQLLIILIIVIGSSLVVSIVLLVWWYRRTK